MSAASSSSWSPYDAGADIGVLRFWDAHGAALFVRLYPSLTPALDAGDYGKLTLPRATQTSPWPWIGALGGSAARRGLASRRSDHAVR